MASEEKDWRAVLSLSFPRKISEENEPENTHGCFQARSPSSPGISSNCENAKSTGPNKAKVLHNIRGLDTNKEMLLHAEENKKSS